VDSESKTQRENVTKEKITTMDKEHIDAPREDPLKEEENRLLERSILKANREAIQRLRKQRIQLLRDCMLSSDSENENKQLDIQELDKQWQDESNRTTLVLETIYDNLRMRDATSTYKNTSVIKNKDGEQLYKVTTIVMTEKLNKQANDSTKIQGTIEIKNNKCEIKYKHGINVSYQMRFVCALWLLKYLFQRRSIRELIIEKNPETI